MHERGTVLPPQPAERWPRTKEQGCKWPFAFPSLVPEETGDSGTLPRRSPPRRPVAVRPSSDTPGVERPLSVPPTAPPAMTPLSVSPEPSEVLADAPLRPLLRFLVSAFDQTTAWFFFVAAARNCCASLNRCWPASAVRPPDIRGVVTAFGLQSGPRVYRRRSAIQPLRHEV